MKHDSKGISEWTADKKYGRHFPKDFFFAKEDLPTPEPKESRNVNKYYSRDMKPSPSKFKRSYMSK